MVKKKKKMGVEESKVKKMRKSSNEKENYKQGSITTTWMEVDEWTMREELRLKKGGRELRRYKGLRE